jgi:hypothetical protein
MKCSSLYFSDIGVILHSPFLITTRENNTNNVEIGTPVVVEMISVGNIPNPTDVFFMFWYSQNRNRKYPFCVLEAKKEEGKNKYQRDISGIMVLIKIDNPRGVWQVEGEVRMVFSSSGTPWDHEKFLHEKEDYAGDALVIVGVGGKIIIEDRTRGTKFTYENPRKKPNAKMVFVI